jgi:hypothetical protein
MAAIRKFSRQHRLCSRRNLVILAVSLFCGLPTGTDLAKGEVAENSVAYQLDPDTSYLQGCFPPCLCPLMIGVPIKGTFLLTPTGFDGLYNTYAITNISWVFSINRTNLFVTGSGAYKVGGEVALEQELSLDLHLGASLLEHFDSGLVPVSIPFPDIKVSIAMNRQVCYDKVFNVNASPVPVPQVHLGFASTNRIVLSWPLAAAPFILQESSDLTTANWTMVTNAPTVIGEQNQVVLTPSPGNKFYLLVPGGN